MRHVNSVNNRRITLIKRNRQHWQQAREISDPLEILCESFKGIEARIAHWQCSHPRINAGENFDTHAYIYERSQNSGDNALGLNIVSPAGCLLVQQRPDQFRKHLKRPSGILAPWIRLMIFVYTSIYKFILFQIV